MRGSLIVATEPDAARRMCIVRPAAPSVPSCSAAVKGSRGGLEESIWGETLMIDLGDGRDGRDVNEITEWFLRLQGRTIAT